MLSVTFYLLLGRLSLCRVLMYRLSSRLLNNFRIRYGERTGNRLPDSGHSGRVLRPLRRRSGRDVERRIVVAVPVFRNSVLGRDPTLRRPLPGLRRRRRRRLTGTGSGGRRSRTQTSGQMRRPGANVIKLFSP
jgi:hypothetical protein